MNVYNQAHVKDVGKSIAAMTEVEATGRYYGAFIPDAEGEWAAMLYSVGPPMSGHVTEAFSVIGHDIDSIGDVVDTIAAKVNVIPADLVDRLNALENPAMVG